jgi:hypothetical protein
MDKKTKAKFINQDFFYAIIGATQNQAKYGHKVLIDLKNKGYNVTPVNPNYDEIADLKCYPDLISLEERPDVVVLVVGEKNAEKVVQDCVDLNLNRIWFQPGSEYNNAVNLAQKSGFETVIGECIMVQTNKVK